MSSPSREKLTISWWKGGKTGHGSPSSPEKKRRRDSRGDLRRRYRGEGKGERGVLGLGEMLPPAEIKRRGREISGREAREAKGAPFDQSIPKANRRQGENRCLGGRKRRTKKAAAGKSVKRRRTKKVHLFRQREELPAARARKGGREPLGSRQHRRRLSISATVEKETGRRISGKRGGEGDEFLRNGRGKSGIAD